MLCQVAGQIAKGDATSAAATGLASSSMMATTVSSVGSRHDFSSDLPPLVHGQTTMLVLNSIDLIENLGRSCCLSLAASPGSAGINVNINMVLLLLLLFFCFRL